jgi:catechol 2,3-dioxygenase-like lactoylglutathione lyase family enzyme
VLPRPDFPFRGAWLGVGPTRQIHLVETDVPDDRGQHVAFAVADLDAAIDELRAAGVEVQGPRPVGDGPMRQCFVRDPDGNRLELNSG